MKHQAKKQTRSQHMPVVIVCILILVLAVMGLGMHFIKKYIPTKERQNIMDSPEMGKWQLFWELKSWKNAH